MGIVNDIKTVLMDGYSTKDINLKNIVFVLGTATIISLFIFLVYRFMIRRAFYSKSFGISLVCLSLVTAAIIFTIQSSLVVSLGMVGALSIVRFRTAIKDPMDLLFLFWSISVGIICGAGLAGLAIALSVVVTAVIVVLDLTPALTAPMLLVVSSSNINSESDILAVIKNHCKNYTVKSRTVSNSGMNFVVELRVKDQSKIITEISKIEGIKEATLLAHDGEATF